MNKTDMENKFLDYIDGALPADEMDSLRRELASNDMLRRSFDAYKRVVDLERALSKESSSLHANFAVKVMSEIERKERSISERLNMVWINWKRALIPLVGTFAALILVVKLAVDTNFERPMTGADMTTQEQTTGSRFSSISAELKPSAPAEEPKPAAVAAPEIRAKDDEQRKLEEKNAAPQPPAKELAAKLNESVNASPDGISRPITRDLTAGSGIAAPEKDKGQALELDALSSLEGHPGQRSLGGVSGGIGKATRGDAASAPSVGANSDLKQEVQGRKQNEERTAQIFRKTLERFGEADQTAAGSSGVEISEDDIYRPDNRLKGHGGAQLLVKPGVSQTSERTRRELDPTASYQRIAPPPSDENYIGLEENKRLNVSESPSSTFSIDVDTASYTNARRYLKNGTLPPRDSIRIEEFINYFDYNYPVQYEKPFDLSYEIAPSPLETDRLLLKLGLKARDVKDNAKPWNLIFLVDVSGSMADNNKLPLVKTALKLVVDRMRERDKIGIVTYAGDAGVALEPSGKSEKAKILTAIDSLSAGGSTNGSGGINTAYEQAGRANIDGGVNRVILATDGDFNVGITDRSELFKLIEDKRRGGVTLTTLGFGYGNLKDGTLEQLANKGNGNYFYIDSFQEARKVLDTDLLGTLEVVAKDVKLQIEFNHAKVASYRLVGYENRRLNREDFNNDAIDAGEIGSGHTVTAFYELVLRDSPLAKKLSDEYRYQKPAGEKSRAVESDDFASELAFLKLRYKEPEGNESKLLQFPIESKLIKQNATEASADFRFAAAVSYFAHLLRGSQYAGSYTFKEVVALAESSRGEDKHGYRQEFIETARNALALAQ